MAQKVLIYGGKRPGSDRTDFWVAIEPPFITATGWGDVPEGEFDLKVDVSGAYVLPGAIDCHVHFREPGMTHKGNILSESMAAVSGGVTSVLEMPNTIPATTTYSQWEQKCAIARETSLVNYAFFLGATADNLNVLINADYSMIPGVKVFMGSSTGSLLVDNSSELSRIMKYVKALIAVHAEDNERIAQRMAEKKALYGENLPVAFHSQIRDAEACFQATRRAVELARKYDARLHICHITTARELQLLDSETTKIADKRITSEVSPHHLLFTVADYARLGTRIKMNPAVKGVRDRLALRKALQNGVIDMVATDHAPHLLSEKAGDALSAVSGAPMVQFALPVLIDLFGAEMAEKVYCHRPAEVYRIKRRGRLGPGYYADIALVRECEPYIVTDEMVTGPCGWTPLDGTVLRHKVVSTWVNGQCVYEGANNEVITETSAMPLRFG